jgi:hypothetical protein
MKRTEFNQVDASSLLLLGQARGQKRGSGGEGTPLAASLLGAHHSRDSQPKLGLMQAAHTAGNIHPQQHSDSTM